MDQTRMEYNIFEGKSESRIKLRRSGLRWLDDVENNLRELNPRDGAKNKRDKLASVVMKSQVHKRP
jgi:hypothetical protein